MVTGPRLPLAVLLSLLPAAAFAGDRGSIMAASAKTPALPPPQAATFAHPAHRWSLSAGLATRSLDASFDLDVPRDIPWQSLLGLRASGRGDVGLSSGGPVTYDNGSILGDSFGLSEAEYHSSSQIQPTGRIDILGDPVNELRFNSQRTTHSISTSVTDDLPGDSDEGAGGYVRFSGRVGTLRGFTGALSLTWTGWSGDAALENIDVATVTAQRHRTNYTYLYDIFFALPPDMAFVLLDGSGFDGNLSPRKQASEKTKSAAIIDGLYSADLDVMLNEIALTFDVERQLTQRLGVALSIGPTLNVVSTDFDATLRWVQRGSGRTLLSQSWHDSATEVVVGFMAQLLARFDLTRDGRWFIEGHAGYHWLDEVGWSAGAAGGSVDLSSWDVGVGLGLRF